jgi:DNA modification methylase
VIRVLVGDCLDVLGTLDAESVQCCVTSPPYFGLRDYGVAGQIGLERTPDEYVAKMVAVFREVRRVLAGDGTLWLNLGDSYATGAGKVGDCPGGGAQGEAWKKKGPSRAQVPDGKNPNACVPTFQPNRMPLPGLKAKDLIGIPWRVAFALQADGWYLRSDIIEEVEFYCPCGCGYVMEERVWRYGQDREIIWRKPNPMPESVTDRPTKAHEYLFLLSKNERYFYDAVAIAEPSGGWNGSRFDDGKNEINHPDVGRNRSGNKERKYGEDRDRPGSHLGASIPWEGETRNRRSVWTVATQPYSGAHFATFPPALIEPCILAGSRLGDTVLDPFGGAGTTGLVADRLGRSSVLIELNPTYAAMASRRIVDDCPLFVAEVTTAGTP